jgi:hypothetical protein
VISSDMLEDIFHTGGWNLISKTDRFYPSGYSLHELGTCRMGDAAAFVTCGWQNPTMTTSALSMRAGEYLVFRPRDSGATQKPFAGARL